MDNAGWCRPWGRYESYVRRTGGCEAKRNAASARACSPSEGQPTLNGGASPETGDERRRPWQGFSAGPAPRSLRDAEVLGGLTEFLPSLATPESSPTLLYIPNPARRATVLMLPLLPRTRGGNRGAARTATLHRGAGWGASPAARIGSGLKRAARECPPHSLGWLGRRVTAHQRRRQALARGPPQSGSPQCAMAFTSQCRSPTRGRGVPPDLIDLMPHLFRRTSRPKPPYRK